MRKPLTNAKFAQLATVIVSNTSRWVGDTLSMEEPGEAFGDETLRRFIVEVQQRLDRMWTHGVEWQPVPAGEGEPGSSMLNPRVSTLHPGQYIGQCYACLAHMLAEKRTLHCDDCENAARAAFAERRAALADQEKGDA
ncbi:hypothetical protein MEX01_29020 [Methylorubrum extorquens]|uniref:hypothetical protein n=1 Tax=Methylorubrum extorquens TaxID=408 RepID=UPI0011738364|nr:hypothetical protein [Methylorubrum extorquens]GEL42311.1 hypothetical protein MEX01_29020 [Methylorubrum extorquens]